MIKQSLFGVALALATATLAAQAPKPAAAAAHSRKPAAEDREAAVNRRRLRIRYVPAIMQEDGHRRRLPETRCRIGS